jgi:heme/copper-type cytochrome/quinol oxidase subunit 2
MRLRTARRAAALWGLVCALGASTYVAAGLGRTPAQNQEPTVRTWLITASRYRFDPPRIEVFQDDLVKIEMRTDDIAHSLTIDAYRIAKRVSPGHPVTFEFRADQPGSFPYYCNLQIEDGCRQMRGQLVVKPRR